MGLKLVLKTSAAQSPPPKRAHSPPRPGPSSARAGPSSARPSPWASTSHGPPSAKRRAVDTSSDDDDDSILPFGTPTSAGPSKKGGGGKKKRAPRPAQRVRKSAAQLKKLGQSIAAKAAWEGDVDDGESSVVLEGDSMAPTAGEPVVKSRGRDSRTVNGVVYRIEDEQLVLPDDAEGATKIDREGNLLGGRSFIMQILSSPHRPDPNRRYMLSIDAARCAGYRDSMIFFKRNPLLVKLNCSQVEKDELIASGRLHQNMRNRLVTMTTTYNLFKTFGARFVVDGRYVTDDYYEGVSRSLGRLPGQTADIPRYEPEVDTGTLAKAKIPGAAAAAGVVGRPIAFGAVIAASLPQAAFGGAGTKPFGKHWQRESATRTKRVYNELTPHNWMLRYALDVAKTNEAIARWRAEHLYAVDLGTDVFEPDLVGSSDRTREASTMAATPAPVTGSRAQTAPPSRAASTVADEMDVDEAGEAPRRPRSPVHGVFDPTTNVPFVLRSTQPTRAVLEHVDALPHLPVSAVPALLASYDGQPDAAEDDGEDEVSSAQLAAAARAGVSSVSYELGLPTLDDVRPWRPANAFVFADTDDVQ